jgi:hypothetical protein
MKYEDLHVFRVICNYVRGVLKKYLLSERIHLSFWVYGKMFFRKELLFLYKMRSVIIHYSLE